MKFNGWNILTKRHKEQQMPLTKKEKDKIEKTFKKQQVKDTLLNMKLNQKEKRP